MNKLLTLSIAGLLSIAMIGCTKTNEKVELPSSGDDTVISTTEDTNINDIITVGKIMEFDGKNIHIISGDLVEIFEYDNSNEKDFYIGQFVQLTKTEKSNILKAYEHNDFTISHTNMGQAINQISGTLENITDEMITVKTTDGNVDIKTYEAINGEKGDEITAYTITVANDNSEFMILNENSKLLLTISQITRLEDGSMQLDLTDENDSEYIIDASHVSMELDMSKLAIGDTLQVLSLIHI